MFGITSQDVAVTFVASAVTVLLVLAVYRPLLFATLDEEVAEAKGVPVRALSIAFMVVLAVAVSDAVQVVGVLPIFAPIAAPAAIAPPFTTRARPPPSALPAPAGGSARVVTVPGLAQDGGGHVPGPLQALREAGRNQRTERAKAGCAPDVGMLLTTPLVEFLGWGLFPRPRQH